MDNKNYRKAATKALSLAKKWNETVYVYIMADGVEFLTMGDYEPKSIADMVAYPEGEIDLG